jgi:hypothetical protein
MRVVAVGPGVVQVFSAPSGARLATLVALSKTGAVALLADGRIDWIGEPKPEERRAVACVVGRRVLPYELCAERLPAGALAAAVEGDRSYLDP